jgi:hypothetical protein
MYACNESVVLRAYDIVPWYAISIKFRVEFICFIHSRCLVVGGNISARVVFSGKLLSNKTGTASADIARNHMIQFGILGPKGYLVIA